MKKLPPSSFFIPGLKITITYVILALDSGASRFRLANAGSFTRRDP